MITVKAMRAKQAGQRSANYEHMVDMAFYALETAVQNVYESDTMCGRTSCRIVVYPLSHFLEPDCGLAKDLEGDLKRRLYPYGYDDVTVEQHRNVFEARIAW